jgi:hypothetical protein
LHHALENPKANTEIKEDLKEEVSGEESEN